MTVGWSNLIYSWVVIFDDSWVVIFEAHRSALLKNHGLPLQA